MGFRATGPYTLVVIFPSVTAYDPSLGDSVIFRHLNPCVLAAFSGLWQLEASLLCKRVNRGQLVRGPYGCPRLIYELSSTGLFIFRQDMRLLMTYLRKADMRLDVNIRACRSTVNSSLTCDMRDTYGYIGTKHVHVRAFDA